MSARESTSPEWRWVNDTVCPLLVESHAAPSKRSVVRRTADPPFAGLVTLGHLVIGQPEIAPDQQAQVIERSSAHSPPFADMPEARRRPLPVKIVIAGGFGVGKTTTVAQIS